MYSSRTVKEGSEVFAAIRASPRWRSEEVTPVRTAGSAASANARSHYVASEACLCMRGGNAISLGYQGIGLRSRKKPPCGPPLGSVASQTAVSAPSARDLGAFGPPMSLRTHPGLIELTKI